MIQTVIGEIKVSTIYRKCSSIIGGFYYETMVFNIKENELLDDNLSSSSFKGAKEDHDKMVEKHINSIVEEWEERTEEIEKEREEEMIKRYGERKE